MKFSEKLTCPYSTFQLLGYPPSVFRIMWFCGISRNVEPLGIAKQRAVQAADILVTSVKEANGPVLLMGHGVMNRLIAKELVSMGWKEYRRLGNGYWSAGIYSLL